MIHSLFDKVRHMLCFQVNTEIKHIEKSYNEIVNVIHKCRLKHYESLGILQYIVADIILNYAKENMDFYNEISKKFYDNLLYFPQKRTNV